MSENALAATLSQLSKSTGQSFDPSDFSKRLRIQKSIYLLKALGYGPVSKYLFGSYLRGPYSPQLAADYFALAPGTVQKTVPARIPPNYLSPVVDAVTRGNDFLEAAATLRLYRQRNRNSDKAVIFGLVAYQKPHLEHHLEGAWAFLEKCGLLPGSI